MTKIVLGIDVSKKTLDAALIFDNRTLSKQFRNTPEGFQSLAAWLESLGITQVHACLEATGTYSETATLLSRAEVVACNATIRQQFDYLRSVNCLELQT